ncbi:MAG: 50S ribosomal protein L25 [Planctomycetota bacterium]|nr:MAG: 50S ribosomal protein L25 [Planctomycetota bacterium]
MTQEMLVLEAEIREALGSANARRLRRSGRTPAVLYGKKKDNVHLSLDTRAFADVLRHHARVLTVKLPDGSSEPAVVKEIAWDELTDEILHVDLTRVDLDERIHLEVGIELVGDAKGVLQGGMLQQLLHEIEIECRADAIPEALKVDISELGIDDVLRVADLPLPDGVRALRDADELVLHVLPPKRGEVVEEAEAASEPERIGKPKETDEG